MANTWRDEIVRALGSPAPEIDRAGATALSRLADRVQGLEASPGEMNAAAEAIKSLVLNPIDLGSEEMTARYWRGLWFLSQYLPADARHGLSSSYFIRLFGKQPVQSTAKPFVLNGLVAAGGILTPAQLRTLADVRTMAPAAWLDAAVMSRLFSFARSEALDLVAEETIDGDRLILSLDGWRERWDPRVDFGAFVADLTAVASEPTKTKLRNWLLKRGFEDGDDGASSILSDKSIDSLCGSPTAWRSTASA